MYTLFPYPTRFRSQRLVRIDQRADGVGRERGLRETGEDQLQLALVVRDVADREDAGMVGLAGGRVHFEVVVVELQAPVGNGTEIYGQSEERQQAFRSEERRVGKACVGTLGFGW